MKKMNEINKLNPLLEAMNDIDDDIVSETAPVERKRPKYFKPLMIAAAAAVLCGATAVTAVASIKPPKEVIVNDEPLEVADYTVYNDEKGREIRTYVYNMPDHVLGEEKEGCTPVGQVRVVKRDDDRWGGWEIVDEEGNVFHWGINNKKIICDVVDPKNPRASHQMELRCANFLFEEYDIYFFNEDYDGDLLPDKISMYVYRYDDKETARRIEEDHGYEFNEERFDESVKRHKQNFPDL